MISKKKVNGLPSTFGVYLFKRKNKVIYIGKSINIKVRVLSHLKNSQLDKKESLIVNLSDSIESKVTENEFKALLLESFLIKRYQPKYNAICKDGKSYLYIKITIKDDFPKILLCRKEREKNKFLNTSIIFRDKLKDFYSKLTTKKTKGSPSRPGMYEVPQRRIPSSQQHHQQYPRRPIPQRKSELDDVLKKLKEMGK